MRTTTAAALATAAVVVPKMLQVKCSVHNVMYIILHIRTAVVVVVDAHNEVPGINSRYYMHDGVREYILIVKGACFAVPASPLITLGSPSLQWVYAQSARTA